MTKATTEWQTALMAELPGATWEFVEAILCQVANEFFTNTGAWIEKMPIDLRDERKIYYLNPVVGRDVEVLYVHALQKADESFVRLVEPAVGMAGAKAAYVWPAAVINLPDYPTADEKKGLYAIVSLRPKMCAGEVPDDTVMLHFDTIKCGTLGRLQVMTNKPWYDPQSGAVNQRRFRNGMAQARDMAKRGYAASAPSWRYPAWA